MFMSHRNILHIYITSQFFDYDTQLSCNKKVMWELHKNNEHKVECGVERDSRASAENTAGQYDTASAPFAGRFDAAHLRHNARL